MAQKKSFKADLSINPAMQFISPQEETQSETTLPGKAPEGYKENPLYIEKKSKRVQLLMQPSLYEQIKANAQAEGNSINDYIHRTLQKAIKGE